jgi:hypothetical protein
VQVPPLAVDGAVTLKVAVVKAVSETGVGSLVKTSAVLVCIEAKLAAADAPTVTVWGDEETYFDPPSNAQAMLSEAGEAVSAEALIVPVTVASETPPALYVSVNALAPAGTPAQVGTVRVKVTPAPPVPEFPEFRVRLDGVRTRPAGSGVAAVTTIVTPLAKAVVATVLTTLVTVVVELPQ